MLLPFNFVEKKKISFYAPDCSILSVYFRMEFFFFAGSSGVQAR